MQVCEKIKNYGTLPLSNTELLQVLLGEKGSRKLNDLLQQYDLKDVLTNDDSTSNVLRIANLDFEQLKYRGKLTDLETSRIMAAVELGIRIANAGQYRSEYFAKASDSYNLVNYLMPRMRYLNHELFVVLALNAKNCIIGSKIISRGSATSASVDIKQVFSYAITNNAVAIAVCHNHPSGVSSPSPEDVSLTHVIYSASIIMGIPLLDHIIIGDGTYYSFHENGTISPNV